MKEHTKLARRALGMFALLFCVGTSANEQLVQMSQDDAQWIMPAKNYASTRFSGLDQINRDNVAQLEVAWTMSFGTTAGFEAAPLVVGDTMYIVTPWPNVLYAIDTADGSLRWKYEPNPARAAKGVACCDTVNRGAAYLDGTIYYNTLDNHTVAVDAETGEEVWKTQLGEINAGETMTMAPLVVKDKVLVGNSGGEMGVRGWIAALDAETGEVAWRAYSTGPDEDVLIGEEFRPFYSIDREADLGVTTWPPGLAEIGGGTVWGWISYDPQLDLIYYGTGNASPWNHAQRRGDNKWTASIFARNPDSGMARWAYQWSPHNPYNYDGVNESILLDVRLGGQQRRVMVRAERNGHMYMIDRETGEVLSAEPYEYVTVTRGVNLETGRPIEVAEKAPRDGEVTREICPAATGAKDWQPSAYSPDTGLVYVPHQHLCMDMRVVEAHYLAGTPYLGAEVAMYAGPGDYRGEFMAWDPIAAEKVWAIREEFPVWSGTMATAGGVAFYGTMDRWFKAVDAQTGEVLWQFRTESGIVGQPITYLGPDRRQYVAIASGVGGWSGAVVSSGLDPRVPFGALGFVGAMHDLPQVTAPGGTLYVFALAAAEADQQAVPGGPPQQHTPPGVQQFPGVAPPQPREEPEEAPSEEPPATPGGGQAPSNPPQTPSGQAPQQSPSGQAPQQSPSGQAPQQSPSGQAPQQSPSGQAPQQSPSGQAPQQTPSGQAPQQMPSGQGPQRPGAQLQPQTPPRQQQSPSGQQTPGGQSRAPATQPQAPAESRPEPADETTSPRAEPQTPASEERTPAGQTQTGRSEPQPSTSGGLPSPTQQSSPRPLRVVPTGESVPRPPTSESRATEADRQPSRTAPSQQDDGSESSSSPRSGTVPSAQPQESGNAQ